MADDKLQDDALVQGIMRDQARMEAERMPWESVWREIDERVNPLGAGAFTGGKTPGSVRGAANYDVTAVEGLDRFAAAMAAITIPRNTQYIRLKFGDADLDKLPNVRRWCAQTADRLHAMRYAPHAGFQVQGDEDFRQLGTYGTGALWTGERPGLGLFYKTIHLSEIWIDEDFSGRVDTVHRKYELTARQCAQQFGEDALTGRMRDALRPGGNPDAKFEILHVVRPNREIEREALDWRRLPVASIHVAIADKVVLRRKGFHSMPISVSRHVTGPGDKYGQSPAMKVLPSIRTLNTVAHTLLRAAHKIVDPALAFYDDDGISSIITRPGGITPGLVNERGQTLMARVPGPEGSDLPIGLEMMEGERRVVRTAFLEDFFKILTDPSDRMTATQVIEMIGKQGVLVAPYAGRYETEKQNPVTQRDLELAMLRGQVEPLPEEAREAGAWPQTEYENPLTRMARAERAAGLARWIEAMAPLAQVDDGAVFDHIDTDEAAPGLADVLGVDPRWVATPDKVAAKRQAREDAKAATAGVEQLQGAASAYADLAKANQISEAA
ncbi:portal protein [Sphingomonas jatrophae]|uniref:Bacteriophage head to tail connecting protein n=1 Tax=Sphingomonas jatrophae TaxID=1166337 RepID=A0A1I6K5R4_9SPHN|nr:portal protein [Sphingomonas jatrophae]SFR86569.1 Bacteriophage head to tail connecting protein [Sphingomonas jatrophae]